MLLIHSPPPAPTHSIGKTESGVREVTRIVMTAIVRSELAIRLFFYINNWKILNISQTSILSDGIAPKETDAFSLF